MVDALQNLLAELEQFGRDNDDATVERSRKMVNITRATVGSRQLISIRTVACHEPKEDQRCRHGI